MGGEKSVYLHINKNILALMTALLLFSCQSNDGSKTKDNDNKSMLIKEKLVDRSQETPSDSALYKNPDLPVMDRVRDLMSYMTMEEKIGQMTQVERKFLNGDWTFNSGNFLIQGI